MVTLDMLQQVKLLERQKKILVITEKIEKQINYNLMFLLMQMKMLEMKESTTGEMLETYKLQVVIGVHKSISKKLLIKVVLIHINKNKINFHLKLFHKLIIVTMLLSKEKRQTWITYMLNQIQEEKLWNKNKNHQLKEHGTKTLEMRTLMKTN